MTTDIATTSYDNAPVVPTTESMALIESTAASLGHAHHIASALCSTAFAPAHFKNKPEEAAAAILYGAQIGLDPLASLQNVFVIGGRPALYSRTMVAVVLAAGHRIWTEESTNERVIVSGQRKGSDAVETVTWTVERAKLAGYTKNEKYRTDPQAMLYARAAGDVARRIAPDALLGMAYSAEEMHVVEARDVTSRRRESAADLVGPATTSYDDTPTPAEPDPITAAQQRKLGALMREAGITERDDALKYVSQVIGRVVGSRGELNTHEAHAVIDALQADVQATKEGGTTDLVTAAEEQEETQG